MKRRHIAPRNRVTNDHKNHTQPGSLSLAEEPCITCMPNEPSRTLPGSRVDVDEHNGTSGRENLARLAASYEGLPKTLTAITSNGRHYYFQHPGGTVRNSASLLAKDVDIRGDGGYVVAPSSLHASGDKYYWEDASIPVTELPDWLLNWLTNTIVVKKKRGRK